MSLQNLQRTNAGSLQYDLVPEGSIQRLVLHGCRTQTETQTVKFILLAKDGTIYFGSRRL